MDCELRRDKRDPVSLPVELREGCDGVTRDISASGAYVTLNCKKDIGSEIDLTIDFYLDRQLVQLVCRGIIVRVDHQGLRDGVAVRFTETQIQDMH